MQVLIHPDWLARLHLLTLMHVPKLPSVCRRQSRWLLCSMTAALLHDADAYKRCNAVVLVRPQAAVFVDRTHSGRYSNTTAQGGPIPLPPGGLQTPSLTLRLFVDRSLLEVP